ncbi:MAG: hypothetical protein COT73_08660 [Bdellovibrio sp. CG10_big_fil_rev_8_21_14_0_10_47_8]|nr:MAG: hypothetical protein COT73_08660 [Bdellovibrio sp. CG10_big_fil_rev_8_21_14_0_10_47_8]
MTVGDFRLLDINAICVANCPQVHSRQAPFFWNLEALIILKLGICFFSKAALDLDSQRSIKKAKTSYPQPFLLSRNRPKN